MYVCLQVANGNQIKEIRVEELSQLGMLAVLDLSNNDIDHVPPLLGRLTHIRTLQLEGNPFRVPRHGNLQFGGTFSRGFILTTTSTEQPPFTN